MEALAAAQPERGRSYVRIRGGAFRGRLTERSDGIAAVLRESWSAPLRVRCAKPLTYVAFSSVFVEEGATWCGVGLGSRTILEVDRDWELASRGRMEMHSFAVRRDALEEVERRLGGGDRYERPLANLVLPQAGTGRIGEELRRRVRDALLAAPLSSEAQTVLRSELLRLAALLRSRGQLPAARLEAYSRRRSAVRRVEEYLDAYERALPSIADLCAVAEVSERTLEYAFREQIGMAPARYLRVRRLNGVRRDLRAARPGEARVTAIAMHWGFWQLGRFAGEYHEAFGELPSQTRAALRGQRRGSAGSASTTGIVSASS